MGIKSQVMPPRMIQFEFLQWGSSRRKVDKRSLWEMFKFVEIIYKRKVNVIILRLQMDLAVKVVVPNVHFGQDSSLGECVLC